MLLTKSTFDFIEQLDEQNDIGSLVGTFQALIEEFGLTCYMIGDPTRRKLDPSERVWASTWPEEWANHWLGRDYLAVDPVISQILQGKNKVRWSEAANDDSLHIYDEATEFHLTDGLALPIYSRDGMVIGITMGAEHYELSKQDEACLHLASIYFHAKLERLRAQISGKPKLRLTPRERECFSWIAAGKTDWEISQILSISEQTVHEYVHNALIKLNATTRAQGVAVAILTRQILVL